MKRLIACILSIVLLLGLLPITALAADGDDISSTGLTGINAENIIQTIGTYKAGDGTVKVEHDENSRTVSITMNNATLTGPIQVRDFDMNVELIGTNSIDCKENGSYCPLYVDQGALVVTGTGSLDAQGIGYALYGLKGVTIKDATVTASSDGIAVYAGCWDDPDDPDDNDVSGDIIIDGASVNANSTESNALCAALGEIIIRNKASVSGESANPMLYADNNIQINDSTVNAASPQSNGIYSPGTIEISGSNVTANGAGPGLCGDVGVIIKDGSTVESKGENSAGIYTVGSIEINDSMVTAEGYYTGLQKDYAESNSGSVIIKNSTVTAKATADAEQYPSGIYTGNDLVVEGSQVYAEGSYLGIFIGNTGRVSDSWIQAENCGIGLEEGDWYTSEDSVTLSDNHGWVTGDAKAPSDVANLTPDYTIDIPEGGTLTVSGYKICGAVTVTVDEDGKTLLLPADTILVKPDGSEQTIGEGEGSITLDGDVTDNTEYELTLTVPSFEALTYGYISAESEVITITNNGNSTRAISVVTADDDPFIIESGSESIAAGISDQTWKIRPNAGLDIGTHTGTISLLCNGSVVATEQVSIQVKHGHSWSDDWSNDASHHWHECTAEDCDITENSSKGDYAEHTPSDWIVDQAAAASEDGSRHKECTVCGYITETETIPATGGGHEHSWSDDWSNNASSHWHECTAEDCDITEDSSKGDYAEHTSSGWIVDQVATASEDGSRHKECTVCGYITATETIPSTGGGSSGGSNRRPISSSGSSGGSDSSNVKQPSESPAGTPPADTSWRNPYVDVYETAWYYDAVQYVSENGLMNGYSSGRFGADDNLTRAQFAQILYNKEGKPSVNYPLQFSDVPGDEWYTEAIRWAAAQGIVGGYGNGLFGPNDSITREQLAVMLWQYAGCPAAGQELHFIDTDAVSSYAWDALCWAVENGILSGYSDGRLDPGGLASRAQVAQMLMNYSGN